MVASVLPPLRSEAGFDWISAICLRMSWRAMLLALRYTGRVGLYTCWNFRYTAIAGFKRATTCLQSRVSGFSQRGLRASYSGRQRMMDRTQGACLMSGPISDPAVMALWKFGSNSREPRKL